MKNPRQPLFSVGFILFVALYPRLSDAEPVYKCMKDGKASYTSSPQDSGGQCQETKIEEQNPADFARAMEEKKLRQEEERKADEERIKEREVRAKELEAAAAARAARAAEQQLLRQNQAQPYQSPAIIYPYTYAPYWGGPVNPMPPMGYPGQHHHTHGPGMAVPPAQPSPPAQPRPPYASPGGGVYFRFR